MIFDDFLRDVEPEPGAALALFGREVRIENFRDLVGTNPRAGIGDPHVDIEIFANATDFEAVGPATLTLLADNGFPIDMNVQLFILDSTNSVTDSLLIPDLIEGAPYDLNYRAIGKQRTEIKIPIDDSRKQRLLSANRMGIRLQFNTPDYPQLIQLYTDYTVDFKLIADGIYHLR